VGVRQARPVRVAFLTSRFPYPPDRGDRLTVFNVLGVLSRAHEVTLFSFVDGRERPEGLAQVARSCARIETVRLPRPRSWAQAWAGLPLARPSQVSFYDSRRMRSLVAREVTPGRFDVVFAHLIRMAPYVAELDHPAKVLWLADSLGLALRRSMDFAPQWRKPGIAWERWRVDRFTARMSRRFQESWAISPADLADLERIGCANLALVTHGVDERLYTVRRGPDPGSHVVFLGNLSVPHNVDAACFAAREVWPAVRAALPGARLSLVGADPVPAVRRAQEVPGVTVTGPLPDLLGMWAGADVMLAPLRFSTGIQNKVLEAMAAGVPVVTTPSVADALGVRDREHLLVARDSGALASAVVESLRNPEAAQGMAQRAREHVRTHFNWETIVNRLEQVAGRPRAIPADGSPAPGARAAGRPPS
jgi:sugar transferase (PEP-CTERM/EpsH1 system associated)